MPQMRLVSLEEAPRPPRRLTALDIHRLLSRLISEWRAPCVEPGGDGYGEVYWALRILGCRRIALGRGCEASLESLGIFDDLGFQSSGPRVYGSMLDLALKGGPTPLVRLRWKPGGGVEVWVKLEWFNPLSLSVKDRPALYMLNEMGLKPGSRVADSSSSNFAIALAAASALMGFKARVYLPGSTGRLGGVVARAMGAEVVVDNAARITTELLRRIEEESRSLGLVHLNQFFNDMNFESHLRGAAREIDYQASRAGIKLAGAAGGLGTSGHMAAVAFYFKSKVGDGFDVVLAQPSKDSHIPGMRRIETGMPWISLLDIDYSLYDIPLVDAMEVMVEVARSDGILISPSGAAGLAALRRHVEEGRASGGPYVAVIPDTGFKYIDLLEKYLDGELG